MASAACCNLGAKFSLVPCFDCTFSFCPFPWSLQGEPLGGRIINYLLEKCRVVSQTEGERNFHIFYLLLASGDSSLLSKLQLSSSPDDYHFVRQGNSSSVRTLNDKALFREVKDAFKQMGFSEREVLDLLTVVSSVLHLGELQYTPTNKDECIVQDDRAVAAVSQVNFSTFVVQGKRQEEAI